MIKYDRHPPYRPYATWAAHQTHTLEWKASVRPAIEEQVKALSNRELLEETLLMREGDDWEGAMTEGGAVVLDVLETELYKRLIAVGFIEGEQGQ